MIARRQADGLLIVSLERGDDLRNAAEALALREGVVVEMFIRPTDAPLLRIPCEDIGLARWEPLAYPKS